MSNPQATFVPQNPLEISLMKAASDPAHQPQFYHDFLAADIFIIQEGPPAAATSQTIPIGATLRIAPTMHEGQPYLPVFSSLWRLQSVIKDHVHYLHIPVKPFLETTRCAPLILNPGCIYGKVFFTEELQRLLDGSMWKPLQTSVLQQPTQILIGQPARYPTELAQILARLFATRSEVESAYLAHYYNPTTDEKAHTIIALDVSSNYDEIAALAGIAANNVLIPDPPVDFFNLKSNPSLLPSLQRFKPIYEKPH